MANRLYNQKSVAIDKASVGNQDGAPHIYVGFSSNARKKLYRLHDIDLIKQDIINHFHIRKGEKLENPKFGTIIWDVLFEPMTDQLKQLITEDVQTIINFDPRVKVDSVQIDSYDQGIRIEAVLTYLPYNVTEKMAFEFDKRNNIIAS